MEIKPIKTKKDYNEALATIEKIFDAKPKTKEGDLLEVLSILVEKYEEEHFIIDAPDPIEGIIFYMEQNDMSRKDLEPYIGSRARVAEIINKKRNLTLSMIRKLSNGLHISADMLIKEYRT